MKTQRHLLENRQFFILVLSLISLLALVLGSSQGIAAFAHAQHDDRLTVNLAINILNTGWLGKFDHLTLTKAPFYPIFLAINYVLGFPVLITQRLLYIASGLLLIYALSFFLTSRRGLLLLYSVYLFNPVFYSLTFVKVYRDAIHTSFAIATLSLAILIAIDLTQQHNRLFCLLRSIAFGFCFACFWLLREEAIWLLPGLFTILGYGVFKSFQQGDRFAVVLSKFKYSLLPGIACSLYCFLVVSIVNFSHYNVFIAKSELLTKEFNDAYGALLRVKETNWHPYLPVSNEVREKLYATSAKFRELKLHFDEGGLVAGWGGANSSACAKLPSTCGDVGGGWFVWALRDAVAKAGYYDSAPHAFSYYRDLAKEINQLCDRGKLECEAPKSGLMPSLNLHYLRMIPVSFAKVFYKVMTLAELDGSEKLSVYNSLRSSQGSLEEVQQFAELTHNRTNPTESERELKTLKVLGWVNTPNYSIRLSNEENSAIKSYQVLPSPDLVRVFGNSQLDQSRFALQLNCKQCIVSIFDQANQEMFKVSLLDSQAWSGAKSDGIRYQIDAIENISAPKLPDANQPKLAIVEFLNRSVYQIVLPFMAVTAIVLYFLSFGIALRRKKFNPSPLYLLATPFLIACCTRMAILTLIDISSFPGTAYIYIAPCVSLLYVFTILIWCDSLRAFKLRRLKANRRMTLQNSVPLSVKS